MQTASSLLINLKEIVGTDESWETEVRFNWLRGIGQNFVFFANPENASEYKKLADAEFLMPKGIIAITKAFNNRHLDDDDKVAKIKAVLIEKGYDGESLGSSWKRTDRTHNVYTQLATAIANYERQSAKVSYSSFVL